MQGAQLHAPVDLVANQRNGGLTRKPFSSQQSDLAGK
jgi:hypothetical protein